MIRCLAIDDERVALDIIEEYVNRIDNLALVARINDPVEAINFLKGNKIDLIFLDIQMPQLSGIEMLETFAELPPVILTTAFHEYSLKGYEFNVVDYLLKPIAFSRFLKSIRKYENMLSERQTSSGFLEVKSDKRVHKISLKDLYYIESLGNYVIFHLSNKQLISYVSLNQLTQSLPSYFLRIHRSYIINKQYIISYNQENIEIKNKYLPIGRSYKDVIEKINF
ncbi:LytTR family DNA-binding domain-containing protein [Fulvivirgaceae bacterium BMA10]|uniref:LytTR family DNA-binding domain-containing protein n=1 Tax=Splendidivirga corallicola TaxID=3051826 RepID=A0ABT8L039_9BACT|nr:LytTR family DNA-binding domain-containing protein [Fulvivirgaceae bacterium BMA10]